MQIYCILSAIRERKKSFVFTDGSAVSLDSRVGFFITMVRQRLEARPVSAASPQLKHPAWLAIVNRLKMLVVQTK